MLVKKTIVSLLTFCVLIGSSQLCFAMKGDDEDPVGGNLRKANEPQEEDIDFKNFFSHQGHVGLLDAKGEEAKKPFKRATYAFYLKTPHLTSEWDECGHVFNDFSLCIINALCSLSEPADYSKVLPFISPETKRFQIVNMLRGLNYLASNEACSPEVFLSTISRFIPDFFKEHEVLSFNKALAALGKDIESVFTIIGKYNLTKQWEIPSAKDILEPLQKIVALGDERVEILTLTDDILSASQLECYPDDFMKVAALLKEAAKSRKDVCANVKKKIEETPNLDIEALISITKRTLREFLYPED